MIWKSEMVLYGLMILNVLGVAACLVWAWRRGLLKDLDSAATAMFEEPREAREDSDD